MLQFSGLNRTPAGIRGCTQRLHSSSFLGLPYRVLNMNPQKELLWSLRVGCRGQPVVVEVVAAAAAAAVAVVVEGVEG